MLKKYKEVPNIPVPTDEQLILQFLTLVVWGEHQAEQHKKQMKGKYH